MATQVIPAEATPGGGGGGLAAGPWYTFSTSDFGTKNDPNSFTSAFADITGGMRATTRTTGFNCDGFDEGTRYPAALTKIPGLDLAAGDGIQIEIGALAGGIGDKTVIGLGIRSTVSGEGATIGLLNNSGSYRACGVGQTGDAQGGGNVALGNTPMMFGLIAPHPLTGYSSDALVNVSGAVSEDPPVPASVQGWAGFSLANANVQAADLELILSFTQVNNVDLGNQNSDFSLRARRIPAAMFAL